MLPCHDIHFTIRRASTEHENLKTRSGSESKTRGMNDKGWEKMLLNEKVY